MPKDTAPQDTHVDAGWTESREYDERRREDNDYEKPRYKGIIGLDGSLYEDRLPNPPLRASGKFT